MATTTACPASSSGARGRVHDSPAMRFTHRHAVEADLPRVVEIYNAAVATYDDTVVNALAQVSDTLVQIDTLGRQRALQREALSRAQQAYTIETQRYRKGISGYLDVLLAEGRLLDDRASVARADASFAIEHARLIAALGGATSTGVTQ